MAPPDRAAPVPTPDHPRAAGAAPALRACPYLSSASRAWVASGPSADHRCEAVAPAAALSLEKQRRLCLTPDHEGCATFLAALAARDARDPGSGGPTPGWGWVRTTPVVDSSVGLGASVTALVAERRAWQVIPAIALVAALGALGLSNIGAHGPAATSTAPGVVLASPTLPASPSATGALGSVAPSVAPTDTPAPTAPPSAAPPTPTPAPASQTYKVKANDTLYGIAQQFGVSVTAIKTLNGLTSNVIHAGQILKIP